MEKGTSQFLWSAGRCGAMRRGVHAGMPLGTLPCLMPATLGQITSFSKKPSFFGKPAKAKACSSQGLGSPPWACSSQGLGVLAWARWHAPGRRQQGPWGHAGCLRGSGSMSRAWHAPWVGCQGRGMPLGPLEGHGSIWGGCCCQA